MHYEDYLKLRQDLRKKITKLEEHYNQFNSDDYVNAILNESEQLTIKNI